MHLRCDSGIGRTFSEASLIFGVIITLDSYPGVMAKPKFSIWGVSVGL